MGSGIAGFAASLSMGRGFELRFRQDFRFVDAVFRLLRFA